MSARTIRDVFKAWSDGLSDSVRDALRTISKHDVRALEEIAAPFLEEREERAVVRIGSRIGLAHHAATVDNVMRALDDVWPFLALREALPKGRTADDVLVVLREARPAWFAPVWCPACGHKDVLESLRDTTAAVMACPDCGTPGATTGLRPERITPLGDLPVGVDTPEIRMKRHKNGFDNNGLREDIPF